MSKTYKWTVEIEIDPTWVADGFDLDDERAREMVMADLSFAQEYEVGVKVVSAPDPKQVRAEQGYKVPGYKPFMEDE